MPQGTVKWFDEVKGFGFIEREDEQDIFLHHRHIVGIGYKSLDPGDKVTFEIKKDPKGPMAINVKKVNL